MAGQGLSRVDSSSLPINLDQYGVRKAMANKGEISGLARRSLAANSHDNGSPQKLS